MADGQLTRSRSRPRRRLPAALRVAYIYVAARVITTGFFALASAGSTESSRFGVAPDLGSLSLGWDAQWYWFAAVNGYPSQLPLNEAGQVAENQWAFMPLYAYLSEGLGFLLGSWGAGAVAISLAAGYGACFVLWRMLSERLDDSTAMWAVAFFASGPLAAIFQVAYAESLYLLWLFLALWALMKRRWLWLYLLIPLMGFTRPGVLAFSLTLALYGIWRWFRRAQDPLGTREIVHIVANGLWAAAVGFSWQLIAAVVTSDPGAYLSTELAWRRNWIPDAAAHFIPFEGFVQGAAFWFTQWGLGPIIGYVALVVVVAGFTAALLWLPQVRKLGVEIRLWSASYALYLLAVFFPQSSTFRLLLPMSPLVGALAVPRSLVWRLAVLVAGTTFQGVWIWMMYANGNQYWQIP